MGSKRETSFGGILSPTPASHGKRERTRPPKAAASLQIFLSTIFLSIHCPQASRRPIAVNNPALDVGRGERSPIPAVEAVAGVIAADEVSAGRDRHHLVARNQVSRLGVDRIMNLPDRIAQGGGLAVHQKPVSENPQFIARFAHNPLHIVFPWRHSMADPVGLEHNNVTAPRMPRPRADAFHQQMIASHNGWLHRARGHIEWADEL